MSRGLEECPPPHPDASASADALADEQKFATTASQDILTGRISRTVWALAWPATIAFLIQTITNNIDGLLVARLGRSQIAALGLAQNLYHLLFGTVVAVSAATTALVARHIGAREPAGAIQTVRQSLYMAVIGSLFIAIAIGPFVRHILAAMAGDTVSIVQPAQSYVMIALLGLAPLFGMTIIIAAFRGSGDMLTPVKLTLTAALLTAFLDWALIFGKFGFPALGLEGAAWAGVIARVLAFLAALWLLRQSPMGSAVSSPERPRADWLKRIINLGYPAGLQNLLRSGASMLYFSFLGRLAAGEVAIASLTIGLRIESLAFMPGFAFSSAAAAIVGQNLGAKSPNRAAAAGWACAGQSMVVMTVMAAVFFIWAEPIVRVFTDDPATVRLTVAYLRINALSEPFIALSMTLSGALQGAGDTRSPTIVTFVCMWLVRIPLTWYLCLEKNMGPIAAWWTMAGSMMAAGLVISAIWAAGRWKTIRV